MRAAWLSDGCRSAGAAVHAVARNGTELSTPPVVNSAPRPARDATLNLLLLEWETPPVQIFPCLFILVRDA